MDTYNDYMDTLLQEIMDLPGEIYDIPEMQEEEFDVEGYINGNTDYWSATIHSVQTKQCSLLHPASVIAPASG